VLLGIDQGTTGTRACLVDVDGHIVASAYAAHRQIQPRDGWVEHDAVEIWACTQQVIAEVMREGRAVRGLALANQGETVMIWDARTLRPLHNALVWQDTRAAVAVDELARDEAIVQRVRSETGLPLDPYFSAAKLTWLLDHVPEARELAAAGDLRAGTIDTWLVAQLTGGSVFATDASTAARTQLCDTRTLAWSPFLLELFGVPANILPQIRDSDADFGTCTLVGLEGVPIVASLVDQPAALLGQGCIDRGDAKATLGTGCFVYVNTGTERPASTGTLSTVAWRAGGVTTYALDGGVLAFGSAINWLKSLGLLVSEQLDAPLARATDREVICVPALVGLGAPHWDRGARGSWLGMSTATTREDLVAATVQGLACRVAEVIAAVEHDAGFAIRELRVDGGLSRSPGLVQAVADLVGVPVVVAAEDEATVVGACLLAALKLGFVTRDQLRARRSQSRARYEPAISADERTRRLARFARARAHVQAW
jgi:glycerol kinase